MVYKVDFYATLVCVVLVLLLGSYIIKRVRFFQDYSIPEPVVGGLLVALVFLVLRQTAGIEFKFDTSMKDPLMLAFFSSVGLLADLSSLKKGGLRLVVFLACVSVLLIMQNVVGIGIAGLLGENSLIGLLSGSITMTGGHGTGAAWASVFVKEPYNFSVATEVAMASATFGLVAGGIIGGPVARYIIKKYDLKTPGATDGEEVAMTNFEEPQKERLITQKSFIESLALISVCLLGGTYIDGVVKSVSSLTVPTFVYCLVIGLVLRNTLGALKIFEVFDKEVSLLGNVSLSLFLALSLMTINLWQLVSLALPIATILTVQVALTIFFAVHVTFRFSGKDYDAAVLSAGHCGFGLGATPTAMVNMQAVTSRYGMSHLAFIIVPLCGAFLVDIVNLSVITFFLKFVG